jgi:Protein of unknown function (DUF1329)
VRARVLGSRPPLPALWLARLVGLVAFAGAAAHADRLVLPPEHECPAAAASEPGAAPIRLREGMALSRADLLRLSPLLPPEVWRHRDAFFPDGMRMVIASCHRRYPPTPAYRQATASFAGKARLDPDGNLTGYTAGLPFPAESIDSTAGDAGARWAWNLELRDRGAGPVGRFRITERSEAGDAQTSSGSWFQLRLAHRADLAPNGYRVTDSPPAFWIAGGRFAEPADARGLAWQQTRSLTAAEQPALPDDVFVFVPSLAKVRRAATAWIDGLYLPRPRGPGAVAGPAGAAGSAGAGAATEGSPLGFLGLSLRPNAYVWRVLGVRDVIAPLNAARGGFPGEPDRSFGASELSLADDRWEVRQAIAIQGALRERGRDYDWLTLYIDTETAQPLYVVTERRGVRRKVGVGILLHRWSGDQPGYPAWPDGQPAAVFDPAAEVFVDESDGSGWRRESYDARSLPLPADEQKIHMSLGFLQRAH